MFLTSTYRLCVMGIMATMLVLSAHAGGFFR